MFTAARKLVTCFAVSAALAAASLIAVAPQAQAGSLCNSTGICGQLANDTSGTYGLTITCQWLDNATPTNNHVVSRGGSSTSFCKDADGFYVPSNRIVEFRTYKNGGCYCEVLWLRQGNGWHKITDQQQFVLRVR